MDDTQQSRISDASATRKRRSSILKSQRLPRAPLSELEFNVATPTDCAKSRRVSFSRRTGVAEFITNEATTTWKNFYEEHNKTLESSGNESEVNPPRPPVGHLGKRIFDQQFQEVEVIDFGSTLDNGRGIIETSMNNANQIENTDDPKLTAPQQNFELSAFTEHHNKFFQDDLAISGLGEITDRINVNFSAMENFGGDDLDDIQKDVERQSKAQNVVFQGPLDTKNSSGYIEVDLNATHVTVQAEQSDMSITDTVHSRKVNVSKGTTSIVDKFINKDWVADKENIVVNPYVAPKESANFAINEESDKILVFDGKRLTIQSDSVPLSDYRKTLLPNTQQECTPQRKTIVLNVDDDLPNFVDNPQASISQHSKIVECETAFDIDLSMTEPLAARLETNSEKRKTIVFDSDAGNISLTQAISTNIVVDLEKRRTIVFDANDISVTQAVPSNLIISGTNKTMEKSDESDMSFTHVFSHNAIVLVPENISPKLSSPKASPSKIPENGISVQSDDKIDSNQTEKPSNGRKTILFLDEGDVSMTQAIPSNLILPNNLKPNLHETLQSNLSTTRAGNSIVFAKETADLSMTQAVPFNLLLPNKRKSELLNNTNAIINEIDSLTDKTTINIVEIGNISRVQHNDHERMSKNTCIVKKTSNAHTSMRDGLSTQTSSLTQSSSLLDKEFEKETTIVYKDEDCEISMTQAVPASLMLPQINGSEKRNTAIFEPDADISVTQAIPTNIISTDMFQQIKSTIEIESDDVSLTDAMATDLPLEDEMLLEKLKLPIEYRECSANSSATTVIHETNCRDPNDTDNPRCNFENEYIPTKKLPDDDCFLGEPGKNLARPIPGAMNHNKNILNNSTAYALKTSRPCDVMVFQASTSYDGRGELRDLVTKSSTSTNNEPRPTLVNSETILSSCTEGSSSISTEIKSKPSFERPMQNQLVIKQSIEQSLLDHLLDMNDGTDDSGVENNKSFSNRVSINRISFNKLDSNMIDGRRIESSEIYGSKIESKMDSNEMRYKIKDGDGIDDKSITVKLSELSQMSRKNPESESSRESMFYITGGDADLQSDQSNESVVRKSIESQFKAIVTQKTPLQSIEAELENGIQNLGKKLIQLQQHSIISTKTIDTDSVSSPGSIHEQKPRTLRDADSKDIIDLLSRFTDIEEQKDPIEPINDLSKKPSVESRRRSTAQRRQSVVLSREELINNISMAQAALQQPCDMDASEENIVFTSPSRIDSVTKKSVHMSPEVVKTLHFEDDESISETDLIGQLKSDLTMPLKKTAFGESAYMTEDIKRNENKSYVIPSYLKDVSDGIKALMTDLVKPVSDVLPFDSNQLIKKKVSTCSTEMQANLFQSSQIDIDPDCPSIADSLVMSSGMKKLKGIIKNSFYNSSPTSPRSEDEWPAFNQLEPEIEEKNINLEPPTPQISPTRVIMFDPHNPLNNILIGPMNMDKAHKYEPCTPSDEEMIQMKSSQHNPPQVSFKDYNKSDRCKSTDHIYTNYNIPLMTKFLTEVSANLKNVEKCDAGSSVDTDISSESNIKKDHSIGTLVTQTKEIEVNTVIVMKENYRLLKESSSLTLVDDVVNSNGEHSVYDTDSGTSKNLSRYTSKSSRDGSPVKVIYEQVQTDKLDSDINSDEEERHVNNKRKSDSHKNCSLDLDVTPKPASKQARRSISKSNQSRRSVTYAIDTEFSNDENQSLLVKKLLKQEHSASAVDITKSPKSKSKRSSNLSTASVASKSSKDGSRKYGTTFTVQRMTECHTNIGSEDATKPQIYNIGRVSCEVLKVSPEAMKSISKASSILSSNTSNSRDDKGDSNSSVCMAENGRSDWIPDVPHDLNVQNVVNESDSKVDIVSKLHTMPFIKSRDCEWESLCVDKWTFRLLLGRLRLCIQLAPQPDNIRGGVKGNTPCVSVTLEAHQQNLKSPIAVLCVRFAAEAIRYFIGAGCSRAADVPALLRRCAGVARVALRWGRAMHAAAVQLAYTLDNDGFLTLKVANVHLRTVWEVSMRIELIVSDACSVPWPRASHLRARCVLGAGGAAPPAPDVRRIAHRLRRDWGHAPRTLWKIFKYLKNKTQDDSLLLGIPSQS